MAARTADLYLQIGGSADGLTAASKAGRTALLNLVGAANDVSAEVEKAFADLGKDKVESELKGLEQSFDRTFRKIKANAQEALAAPTNIGAAQILNAAGADQAAAAAEAQAAQMRLLADAATTVASRAGDAGKAEKVLATVLETQAVEAGNAAAALRAQAGVLAAVANEAGVAAKASDAVAESHGRMGASGMIAEHVVRAFSDSIAAGQSPVRALTMEMGRITEAMVLYANQTNATTGVMGKLASFLMGGWGIAFTVGIAVLTPMIEKLFEAGDAAEKAKKAEEEYANFQSDLGNFVDGANGKLRERLRLMAEIATRENAGKIVAADKDAAALTRKAFDAANAAAPVVRTEYAGERQPDRKIYDPAFQAAIAGANGDPGKLAHALEQLAQVRPDLQKAIDGVAHVAGEALHAKEEADKLRGTQAELKTLLANGKVGSTALIDERIARLSATTPVEKAQERVRAIRKGASEIDAMPAGPEKWAQLRAYNDELTKATADLKRAQDAAKLDKKTTADNAQSGRSINLAQAESIVRGIGATITSSTRSYEKQAELYARYKAGQGPLAAKPGTSNHELGQALDIAKTPGMTLARIVEAFRAQGVNLSERLDEGDHFHVAWGKKGPSADTLAKRQEGEVHRAANDDRAYQAELGAAQERIARARGALADTAEGRYNIEVDAMRAALVTRDHEIDDQVTAGKITAARALILKISEGSAEALGEEAAKKKLGDVQLDRKLGIERDELTGQITLLNLQGGLALTARDRQRIALHTLDAEEKLARDTLQAAIAKEDDPDKRAALQAQVGNVGPTFDLRRQQASRQDAGPLDSYRLQLKSQVGDINQALQGVEVDAIQKLGDSFEGAVAKALHLHGVLGDIVGDLLKVGEQKLLFALVGGASTGGLLGGLLHFAEGGAVAGPGGPREDRILARLSAGEFVVNAAAYARHPELVQAINSGELARFADGGLVGGGSVALRPLPDVASLRQASASGGAPIVFDMRGAVMTAELLQQVNAISAQHATVSIVAGAAQARQDAADDAFARIPA